MRREPLVGAVYPGFVTTWVGDPHSQVVGHQESRSAAEELEGPDVSADPTPGGHVQLGFSVDHVACAEDGHEHRSVQHFAGRQVDVVGRLPGVVHVTNLAGGMIEAHCRPQPPAPGLIELAESAVAVAVGMVLTVLAPDQLTSHPLLPELLVHAFPVGQGSRLPLRAGLVGKEEVVESGFSKAVRERPRQTCALSAVQVVPDSRVTQVAALTDCPVGQADVVVEPTVPP